MHVEALKVDREVARQAYLKYRLHRDYMTAADKEIAAIYRRIAKGETVIRAFESIRNAGVDLQGRPKLAIARADQTLCYLHSFSDAVWFDNSRWGYRRVRKDIRLRVEWPGFKNSSAVHEARVPLIPVHLRPKTGLAQYHILWEAEWSKTYPRDPYLLKRFGGDAWLVVAAWDLTDIERAVMQERLSS